MPRTMKIAQSKYPSFPSSGWGYVLAGCIFAIEFSLFIPAEPKTHNPHIEWVIFCLATLYLLASCYFYYSVHRIHRILRDATGGAYPITPFRAVALHFVPIFNIYWMFAWTNRITEFCNSTSSNARMKKWWMGAGLLVASLIIVVGEFFGLTTPGEPLAVAAPSVGIVVQFGILQYVTIKLKRALGTDHVESGLPISQRQLFQSAGLGSGFAMLAGLGAKDLFFPEGKTHGLYEVIAIFIVSAGVLVFIDPMINQLKELFGKTEEDDALERPQQRWWQVIGFFIIALAVTSHTALHKITTDIIEQHRLRQGVIIAFGTLVPAVTTRAWLAQIQRGRSAAWAGGCVGVIFAVLVVLVKTAIRVPDTPDSHKIIMAVGSACQFGACGYLGGLALDRRWGSSAIRGIELVFAGVTLAVLAVVVPLDHFVSQPGKEGIEVMLYFARVVGWCCGIRALEPAAEALLRPQAYKRPFEKPR